MQAQKSAFDFPSSEIRRLALLLGCPDEVTQPPETPYNSPNFRSAPALAGCTRVVVPRCGAVDVSISAAKA